MGHFMPHHVTILLIIFKYILTQVPRVNPRQLVVFLQVELRVQPVFLLIKFNNIHN